MQNLLLLGPLRGSSSPLGAFESARVKLAYKLAGWPAQLATSAFNQLGQYANSPGDRAYCGLQAMSSLTTDLGPWCMTNLLLLLLLLLRLHCQTLSVCVLLDVQGCMPNGCCRSGSGKLVPDHQYPRDTYVVHDGHVASCSLLNSSTNCSSHRVCRVDF